MKGTVPAAAVVESSPTTALPLSTTVQSPSDIGYEKTSHTQFQHIISREPKLKLSQRCKKLGGLSKRSKTPPKTSLTKRNKQALSSKIVQVRV